MIVGLLFVVYLSYRCIFDDLRQRALT